MIDPADGADRTDDRADVGSDRVESAAKLDAARTAPPYLERERDINRSFMFANYNTSKLGLSLDLSTAEGVGVARRLVGAGQGWDQRAGAVHQGVGVCGASLDNAGGGAQLSWLALPRKR